MREEENSKWKQYWLEGDTGWKHPEADKHFFESFEKIEKRYLTHKGDALVPLCGDSPVVRFLYDHAYSVTAVDMVAEALQSLKKNSFQDINFAEEGTSALADRLLICQHNFLTWEHTTDFNLIYDRAALIALHAELRIQYAKKVSELLAPGGILYVESIQGDENLKTGGPPFAVEEKEVDTLYTALTLKERRVSRVTRMTPGMLKRGVQEVDKVISIYQK